MPPPPSAGVSAKTKDSGKLTAFGKAGPTGDGPLFTENERLAIAKQLSLTQDQQDRIQKILTEPPPKDFKDRIDRLYKADTVLTREQSDKAHKIIPAKIMARLEKKRVVAKSKLPADEFKSYDNKFEKIRQDFVKSAPSGVVIPTPKPLSP